MSQKILLDFPKPVTYTVHLSDGRIVTNQSVTDASIRRWASLSPLAPLITKVTREIDSGMVVVFSKSGEIGEIIPKEEI